MKNQILKIILCITIILIAFPGCAGNTEIDKSALREKATNELIDLAKNGNLDERKAVANLAGTLNDETAAELLRIGYSEKTGEVADIATERIRFHGYKSTEDILREELGDGFDDLILESLVEFGADNLDMHIEKGLASLRPNERAAAVELLGKYKGEEAKERIESFLDDPELIVRIKAIHALGRMDKDSINDKLDELFKDESVVGQAGAVAIAKDLDLRDYEPQIVTIAREGNKLVATEALTVLYDWESTEASDILLERIDTKDMMTFYNFLTIADEHKDKNVVGKLKELTASASPQERYSAARVVLSIEPDNPAILDFILKGMDSDIPQIRSQTAILLGNLPGIDKVKTILINKGLKDDNRDVVLASVLALGEIGDTETLRVIVPFMEDKDSRFRIQSSTAVLDILDREEGIVRSDEADEM